MSRDEYIEQLKKITPKALSEPKYKCPVCGGDVRMNNNRCIVLCCDPPIIKEYYQCDDCDFNEYIKR